MRVPGAISNGGEAVVLGKVRPSATPSPTTTFQHHARVTKWM